MRFQYAIRRNSPVEEQRDRELEDFLSQLVTPWVDFTPTWTNYTRGNGTVAAEFRYVGDVMEIRVAETLGTTSSFGVTPAMTLPDGRTALDPDPFPVGFGDAVNTGIASYASLIRLASGKLTPYWYDPFLTEFGSADPFIWGSTDVMSFVASVKVAR